MKTRKEQAREYATDKTYLSNHYPPLWQKYYQEYMDSGKDVSMEDQLREIVESGRDIDYGYDGENETVSEIYNSQGVVEQLVEFIRKLQNPTP